MSGPSGKAAVFVETDAPLPLEVREYAVDAPGESTALLSLSMSGICGTDIHILEGRLPIPPTFIPGHEFLGVVEALGPGVSEDGLGAALAEGDRVVACVALPCGECFMCTQGETASCLAFGVTNVRDPEDAPYFFGGFAEYLHQPAKTLVRIPDGVSIAAAAAFPCAGPTVLRALDFAGGITGDELVVVQGTGPVGLFAVAYAAARGCTVVAVGSGRSPERMELAARLGATETIDYRAGTVEDRVERVKALAGEMGRGDGADVVIEASGAPSAVPEGMQLVRTRGTYCVPGQYSASGPVEITPEMITFKAIRIIGSAQYKLADVGTYLQFLVDHPDAAERFSECISHRFAVADAAEAVRAASAGETVKAVFVPEQEADA